MKKLFAILIAIFIFQLIPISRVYANLDDSIFIIKATWPTDGQINVPVDLKSGLTDSSYSDPLGIGNIAIGYGTDLSGGCGEPPNCPNIPNIKNDSINSSTVTISSPNDPSIFIKFSGTQECYGQCYGNDGFYHNFSIIPVNSALPNGIRLMPNTTYTITLKGGSFGIRAIRSIINGSKEVILSGDYSWSFTTGEGSVPSREASVTPQPTLSPTPAPSTISTNNTPTSNNNELINPIPTPTNSPSPKTITQAIPKTSSTTKPIINNKNILGIATPSASATFSGQISSSDSAQPKTQEIGFLNSVINFVRGFFKNIFRFLGL